MTRQVNRTEGLALAAIVTPVIAAFIGLSAPRAVPLGSDVPAPRVPPAAARASEEEDLRRIERMRDSPALRTVDRMFGLWNQSEVEGRAPVDPVRSLRLLQVAYRALSRDERRAFLADRSQRFLVLVHRIRAQVARRHEDRESVRALRLLVGGQFEARALDSGLLDADDVVLRAAFKLRVLLAVEPSDVGLVSRVERLAWYGFVAARAKGQSIDRRLRAVDELARLDRDYPAHLAAAQLHALGGDWDQAVAELQRHPRPSVRTRNHLLWLARQQQIRR